MSDLHLRINKHKFNILILTTMKKIDVNMKVLIAIIAIFGISLSLMAQPQQRQQMPQKNHGGLAGLDLTEDQKAEIKAVHLSQMKETQPLTDEVNINRAKLKAAMHKDNPDMKEIVSLVESNAKILTDIQVNKIEAQIKVRTLLTEEQKVIFDTRSNNTKAKRAVAQRRMQGMAKRMPARHRF